jgi:hypothetical protein
MMFLAQDNRISHVVRVVPACYSISTRGLEDVLLLHDNSVEYDSWDIDARPLFEIAVCYAA